LRFFEPSAEAVNDVKTLSISFLIFLMLVLWDAFFEVSAGGFFPLEEPPSGEPNSARNSL